MIKGFDRRWEQEALGCPRGGAAEATAHHSQDKCLHIFPLSITHWFLDAALTAEQTQFLVYELLVYHCKY